VIAAGIAVAQTASVANALAVVFQAAEDRRSPPAQAGRFELLRTLMGRPRCSSGAPR
jgi:hypothetical protein